MKSKQKHQPRRVSKEKANTVAEGSLQTRAPGAGPSRGNEQSGSQNAGFGGVPGVQQSGWSSRQQADRIIARAEESRLGMAQQSSGTASKSGGGSKK